MHKGIVAAAHEAEHEVAAPLLNDQPPGGAIGPQPRHAMQRLAERGLELRLLNQIDQVASGPIRAGLQSRSNSLRNLSAKDPFRDQK